MDSTHRDGPLDEQAIDSELDFHFSEAVEALVERGWSEPDAKAEAERRFGDRERYRRDLANIGRTLGRKRRRLAMRYPRWQNVQVSPLLESIVQDVQFGLRLFRKNATVAVAAVVSLSLAIAACTASFSLIDALILRPLPVSDPERLVYLAYRSPGDSDDSASGASSRVSLIDVGFSVSSRSANRLASPGLCGRRGKSGDIPLRPGSGVSRVGCIAQRCAQVRQRQADRQDQRVPSINRSADRVQFHGAVRRGALSGQFCQARANRSGFRPAPTC